LLQLGRVDDAIAAYEAGLAKHPKDSDLLTGRGRAFAVAGRPQDAIAQFEQSLRVSPGEPIALGGLVDGLLDCCDWTRLEQPLHELRALAGGGKAIPPLTFLRATDDPAWHCSVARSYVKSVAPARAPAEAGSDENSDKNWPKNPLKCSIGY